MKASKHPLRPRLDIIGDVHGELGLLVRLLENLGYTCHDATLDCSGVWVHPTRTVVFVGDLIDRGPDSPGVVRLVRRMVEAGHALVVLGNHELNAIARVTADEEGNWLRARTPDKTGPHQTTLDQYATAPTSGMGPLSGSRRCRSSSISGTSASFMPHGTRLSS